jgi:hypothetical protein
MKTYKAEQCDSLEMSSGCPFCGTLRSLRAISCFNEPEDDIEASVDYYILCDDCGATGPEYVAHGGYDVDGPRQARKLWDKREGYLTSFTEEQVCDLQYTFNDIADYMEKAESIMNSFCNNTAD